MTSTDRTKPATTHTPGPWDYDMDYIVAPDLNGRHPDIYIAEIAHSDDEGRIASPEQQDANRRLIAAAPNLLEALEKALPILEAHATQVRLMSGNHLYSEAYDKALAAIVKATAQDCDWR